MKGTKRDLIKYRLIRARDTYEDAQILADRSSGIRQLAVTGAHGVRLWINKKRRTAVRLLPAKLILYDS
jgi:hypothetical protein